MILVEMNDMGYDHPLLEVLAVFRCLMFWTCLMFFFFFPGVLTTYRLLKKTSPARRVLPRWDSYANPIPIIPVTSSMSQWVEVDLYRYEHLEDTSI